LLYKAVKSRCQKLLTDYFVQIAIDDLEDQSSKLRKSSRKHTCTFEYYIYPLQYIVIVVGSITNILDSHMRPHL